MDIHPIRCFLFVVGTTLVPSAAAIPPTEEDFLGDIPVVLSVTRLAQSKSTAPGPVTVIDRQMIEASGFREIADLFRLVPGFNVSHNDVFQTRSVTYRGLSDGFSRQMQVLVDGRTVYDPILGFVDWYSLPLSVDDIDRIEVVRGPNAAAFGSNAFVGIINIFTRPPGDTAGSKAMVSFGANQVSDAHFRHGWRANDVDYRITLATAADDPFANRNDGRRYSFASGRAEKRLGAGDTLDMQAAVVRGNQESGDFGSIAIPPHDSSRNSGFLQVQWLRSSAPGSEWKVQAFHWWFDYNDAWTANLPPIPPIPPSGMVPANLNYRARRDDVEFQHAFASTDMLRVVWGGGIRNDRVESQTLFDTSAGRSGWIYRLFGNAEWRPAPEWTVHASAMIENNYINGTELMPRAAVNYAIHPDHTVRAGIYRGVRMPTFLEQYGNENYRLPDGTLVSYTHLAPPFRLRAETLIAREIGYVGRIPRAHLTLDARVFLDNFRHLIDDTLTVPSPGELVPLADGDALQYTNANWAEQKGIEMQIDWRPSAATRLMVSEAIVRTTSSDPQVANSAPPTDLSVLFSTGLGSGVDASLGYYRTGRMRWLGEGSFIARTERLDLRLSKAFKAGATPARVSIVVQNALAPYSEFRVDNRFDTRAFAMLEIGH